MECGAFPPLLFFVLLYRKSHRAAENRKTKAAVKRRTPNEKNKSGVTAPHSKCQSESCHAMASPVI
jgi:hypothetical protein